VGRPVAGAPPCNVPDLRTGTGVTKSATLPPHPAGEGLPSPLRQWALFAQVVGVSTTSLDGLAMNLALPGIAADFDLDPTMATWLVNSYQVALIAMLLPMAAVAQVVGYRRVYLIGLFVFLFMACVSALATSFEMLLVARTLQGMSVSCVVAVNMALLRHIVPAAGFGRALGVNATAIALASTLGPTVAGIVLTFLSWSWVFAISILPALVAAVIGVFVFPETERSLRRFDLPGACLSAVTFGACLLAVSGFGHDWPIWTIAATAALAMGAGILLVRRMRGQDAPLLPVDLLRIPLFALSLTASCCAFGAQFLIFVVFPFHLQGPLGMSPFEAGLVFSAWPLALALAAPLAGTLADRGPAGLLGMLGLSAVAAGLGLILLLPDGAGSAEIALCLAICGAGFAFFQTPNNRVAISVAPRPRSSAATGSLATARMLGQALGTAMAALALSGQFGAPASVAVALAMGLSLIGATASILRRG
jgi:MFS transporter, DHA2 family, multidrug resistance protein